MMVEKIRKHIKACERLIGKGRLANFELEDRTEDLIIEVERLLAHSEITEKPCE